MIQGLLTRPLTDEVVKPFVESAKGTLHSDGPNFDTVNFSGDIACFGVLRGTGEVMAQANNFYYFDHAYMFGNRHLPSKIFKERIYRLTKNYQHIREIDRLKAKDKQRIQKYKEHIDLKNWNVNGDYVLVCDISEHAKKFYDRPNWLDETVKELKKHTKREIRVRSKGAKTSFKSELKKAHAVVSFQSTVCVDALVAGVPSFCDKVSMGIPVSLDDLSLIEDPLYPADREQWIDSLLANQFTMTEIKNGTAWEKVK
ncbi:MAG: hypothetical protein CMO44_19000 [Verrucomicrobiales bacterium]|nr:hypothetical protein [Verrucomicrobiales bacterium]|tara:strand:- start:100 stop:867 length:768 start_codon:yes stop_codon:yes gene_type:complete